MTRPEPITGASQYLGMIKKQHDVYIVTARDERYRQETMDWLSKYNLPYDELLLLGSHEKKEACLSRNLSVLVEDKLEIGVKVSSAGVPVLLLDAPITRVPCRILFTARIPGLTYTGQLLLSRTC